jgi:hypothetical protein
MAIWSSSCASMRMFLTRTSSWLYSGRRERAPSESRSQTRKPAGPAACRLIPRQRKMRVWATRPIFGRSVGNALATKCILGEASQFVSFAPLPPTPSTPSAFFPLVSYNGNFSCAYLSVILLRPSRFWSNTHFGRAQTVLVGAVCPAPRAEFSVTRAACAAAAVRHLS